MFRKLFGSSAQPASASPAECQAYTKFGTSIDEDPEAEELERMRCRELLAQRAEVRRVAERKRGIGGSSSSSASTHSGAASTSSSATTNGSSTSGTPAAAGGEAVMLTVIRSARLTPGQSDDIWQVEVPSTACVWDVKDKIEELYDIPIEAQRLQPLEEGCEAWPNDCGVDVLAQQPFYLVASDSADAGADNVDEAEERDFQAYCAAMEEKGQEVMAVEESLRGVQYKVRFSRPESTGGLAPGRNAWLLVDALSLISDVQLQVEQQLFGGPGRETAPVFLTFNGQPLPPHLPLHFTGVGDGDTVIVAAELLVPCSGW